MDNLIDNFIRDVTAPTPSSKRCLSCNELLDRLDDVSPHFNGRCLTRDIIEPEGVGVEPPTPAATPSSDITREKLSLPQAKDYQTDLTNPLTLKEDEYRGRINYVNGYNDAINTIESLLNEARRDELQYLRRLRNYRGEHLISSHIIDNRIQEIRPLEGGDK